MLSILIALSFLQLIAFIILLIYLYKKTRPEIPEGAVHFVETMRTKGASRGYVEQLFKQSGYDDQTIRILLKNY